MIPQIIKDLAKKVREAKLGKEVRESIAKSMEETSIVADEANTRSQSTENRQDLLETKYDEQLKNSDDVTEVKDAHVSSYDGQVYDTIGKRMDNTDANLAQIMYDMSDLVGDGVTDDGVAIQSIINLAKINRVKKITFPKATYRIDNPIYANVADIDIDFSGSTILNYAKANNNKWGEIGLFNFHGELVDGDIINYMRDNIEGLPVNTPILYSYESHKEVNYWNLFLGGKITTSDNSFFNVGDNILIRGVTSSTGAPYDKSKYTPEMTVIAKVVKVDSNFVYIDYFSPFEYPNFVNRVGTKSVAMKVKPLNNVRIRNFNVVDMVDALTSDGTPPTDEKKTLTSIVSAILCDGIDIENVEVEGHRANAFEIFYSRNVKETKLKAKNAKYWDGGLGYLTQIRGSRDIHTKDILGVKCRHVVDFSFSCYGLAENVEAIDSYSNDLDLHGICEHNITFKKCKGKVALGNGLIYFPNMVKNITFENSEIQLPDNHLSEHGLQYIDNLKIINSNVIMYDLFNGALNVEVDNSKIEWVFWSSNIPLNLRGQDVFTSLKIKDTDFKIRTVEPVESNQYFRDYDFVVLDNLDFEFIDSEQFFSDGNRFNLLDIGILEIKKIKTDNISFRYINSRPHAKLLLKNSEIDYTRNEKYFLMIDQLTNCYLVFDVFGNEVNHRGVASQFFVLDARSANKTNATITGKVRDNTFKGNLNAKLHYIYTSNVETGVDARIFDYNNVIEHKDIAESVKWDVERNFIIS